MMKNREICCIFNYPPHYRYNIYKLMEDSIHCDFYFGDIESESIKKFDFNLFTYKIKELKTISIFHYFNWIKGSVELIFKPYKTFIITGEPYCLSTWIILLLIKFTKKKTYLWSHGWYGDEGVLKKIIKKKFFNLANGVFLYGERAKHLMIKEGLKKDKLHVIYNSLHYDLQKKIRDSLKQTNIFTDYFGNELPVIIFTGRITTVKQINLLVESHTILTNQDVKFNVVIVGNGPELNNIKTLVNKCQLEKNYWFYGECYNEDIIGELYYNSTLCVSPGNVGLTAIHSMMYGCPVITHNNFAKQMPEFEVISPEINGLFYNYKDVESLANVIKKWLINKYPKNINTIYKCYNIVDSKYNPHLQIETLKRVLQK